MAEAVAGAGRQGGAWSSMSSSWGGHTFERVLGVFIATALYWQEQQGITGRW